MAITVHTNRKTKMTKYPGIANHIIIIPSTSYIGMPLSEVASRQQFSRKEIDGWFI
jgi:hypothetical protein